jgi:hypothetical protein
MGLLDKAKAAAAEAAIKAKETAEELQARRELNQAYGELGQKAFELVEGGSLTSPELESLAARVRTLKAQLETSDAAASESTPSSDNGTEAQPSNE